ncbi:hypothetical protein BJ508DRAFT_301538 [Ascobolus immersus RN42]|uniref:Uncharacterized protein n=1 Tax=Ascobolus immersus RN42 TaxID=1160509 RepID=A0A3N4IMT6_ASCIM|nr:hypothetical protein BJ508DRAFT_301538 [Ascobolus immersus RN42]
MDKVHWQACKSSQGSGAFYSGSILVLKDSIFLHIGATTYSPNPVDLFWTRHGPLCIVVLNFSLPIAYSPRLYPCAKLVYRCESCPELSVHSTQLYLSTEARVTEHSYAIVGMEYNHRVVSSSSSLPESQCGEAGCPSRRSDRDRGTTRKFKHLSDLMSYLAQNEADTSWKK